MHMEPGIVDGTKIMLSYATAGACALYAAKLSIDHARQEGGLSLIVRSLIAAVLVFVFFEVFPHVPVGVSEARMSTPSWFSMRALAMVKPPRR